ncbi:MAG TPA: hypothetical protein VNT81_22095 [Vicinamibacterales bacterium]|nr:hypothetical protein [Vicinamibacterales bacterium]
MNYRFDWKKTALVIGAVATVACTGGMNTPASPSAVVGGASALNADGSNLKVNQPLPVTPLFELTNVSVSPTLAARASTGRFQAGATLAHRFQVSDSDSFTNIVATGMGVTDASGVTRWAVEPALPAARRFVWRVRAELNDAVGPWSNVYAFTTAGSVATTTPTTTPTSGGNRTPDPAPGQRLPLPSAQGQAVLARFQDASDSCPRGIKYVNNPWQDRVIDALRLLDTRWGYNGKPNRSAADNGGVPVVAAGDEAAYHWGSGPDQGSTNVHLVDMLVGHCGPGATTGWRIFTGEEPAFWTGAGRF